MLIACWSAKGGSGTTVVAASMALLASRRPPGALLVDLAGDAPATLGLPEPDSPGIAGWLAAGSDVPADALGRLEVAVAPGLALLPQGGTELSTDRVDVLGALLAGDARDVVVDCGVARDGAALALARCADRSVLVTRACFLSLRRAMQAPLHPSEVVLVREADRALDRHDIETVVDAPVRAVVSVDPAVARAVDAGLLHCRLPRGLARSLADAA